MQKEDEDRFFGGFFFLLLIEASNLNQQGLLTHL